MRFSWLLRNKLLTEQQAKIWDLHRRGQTQTAIAQILEKSVQFIHKVLNKSSTYITQAILELARINDISISGGIDTTQGITFGYHERFQTEVAITYSKDHGMQIWYKDEGDCTACRIREKCIQSIKHLYAERSFPLPPNHEAIEPRQLSEHLFIALKKTIRKPRRG